MNKRIEMAVEYALLLSLNGERQAARDAYDWDASVLWHARNWLPEHAVECSWRSMRRLFLLTLELASPEQDEFFWVTPEELIDSCAFAARNWTTEELAEKLAALTAEVEKIDLADYRARKADAVLARIEARLIMEDDEMETPTPAFSIGASYLFNKEITRTRREVFYAKKNAKPLAEKLAVYSNADNQWKLVMIVDVTREGRAYRYDHMVVPYRHGGWDYSQWGFASWWSGYSRKAAMAECMA